MIGRAASGQGNRESPHGGIPAAGDYDHLELLHEIEALGKALSLDPKHQRRRLPPPPSSEERLSPSEGRSLPKPSSPASSVSSVSSTSSLKGKEKKKTASLWGWNPIKKALSQITGQRRFVCCFSLHVHYIEGLPTALSGVPLVVQWRRATDPASASVSTSPARVVRGVVQFEETLAYRCAVQGARTGPGGTAKYEARHFLIYPSLAGGAAELDLGRHLVDVTRVLPATLEELEDEKAFGNWSTSYRLSGKARGASLNVSFGFSLVRNEPLVGAGPLDWDKGERKVSQLMKSKDSELDLMNTQSSPLEEVKVLHAVLPRSTIEISPKANVAGKLDTQNLNTSMDMLKPCMLPEPVKGSDEWECNDPDCMVIEHGAETLSEDQTCKAITVVDATIFNAECKGNKEGQGMKLDKPDGEARIEGPIMESGKPHVEESALRDNLDLISQEEMVDTKSYESAQEGSCQSSLNMQESALLNVDTTNHADKIQDDEQLTVDSARDELNAIFQSTSALEKGEFDSPNIGYKPMEQLSHGDIDSSYKMASLRRSRSIDAVTESVANEFLSVLGIEHSPCGLSTDSEPESPREKLWKQFEKESLASGSDLLGPNDRIEQLSYWGDFSDDLNLSLMVHEAEKELHKINMGMYNSKSRVEILEDAETEALMQEWGLNENNFNFSPPRSSGAFGSPIDLPSEEPLELPPLGEGLGPIVQTKDGGFLRSMSPLLFTNAKNKGKLIMQVSSPVVVPAEMGSGMMEILQRLASEGIEKLSRQASKLMPLEDITGKTMQQIAWDSVTALDSCESHVKNHYPNAVQNVSVRRKKSNSLALSSFNGREAVSEYVTLEDLALMAMDKIEVLSFEGLTIQTGTSNEEAPSNIIPQSIGDISTLESRGAKRSWSLDLEGTSGLQLLNVKESDDDIDGLMGLSLSFDEWMKLDSGIIDDEDQGSDRISKILVAHHANSADMICSGWNGDKRGKRSGKKWGFLGDNFTVSLMVQLRDPLRNYEPVGMPMLALIQVKRVFLPRKPEAIHCNASKKGNNEEQDGVETVTKPLDKQEKHEEEIIPRFKITEVLVAGLDTEPSKRTIWGDPKQQQSGSRWMLATGMGKPKKGQLMKSKTVAKLSQGKLATSQPGDTLWSITSLVHGHGAKLKGLASPMPHTRNPNIILPNGIIKLS
ncbi:protein PLASTID MOVEMENT IMPAIRED 1-RELATED 1-like [Curcuma longa]|uniref:protein PLASTID MOVEMENT IMPAIRED 1-RELATED 1-like n=1 Tax=Curcuma longa TaxID=136217 RepID=UPI003D9F5FFC